MGNSASIRRTAKKIRAEVCSSKGLDPDSLIDAETLIPHLIDHLGLESSLESPESPNLQGALAALKDDIVFVNGDLEGGFRQYCIAHEAGHHVLHTHTAECEEQDLEAVDFDGDVRSAQTRVIGYGPREKKEREANLFALEVLLPCSALRKAFVDEGLKPDRITEKTGMPVSSVNRQLARAVLIPAEAPGEEPEKTDPAVHVFDLDPSQKAAAETVECPVLVSAGPGTGKTATLIGRIVHLLENGADPQKILALTFSNKAAQEMRERVAEARPDDAASLHISTFHAFGYNLLMRYWKEAGISEKASLLDQIDALLMLEQNLSDLKLEHYLKLYDPMRDLPDVLNAISKAKDELCDPKRYTELALQMQSDSNDEDEVLKREKALETAHIYEQYQRLMGEADSLDFGDLIFRPVRLLEQREDVRREVQNSFEHVLVDEFQDVNRASGVLLKLVAGDGKGLWAVGDLRQSIYRWRGASPENIRRFHEEYENARTLSLKTNYRSVGPIVRAFGRFGSGMIAREPFNEWEAFRGEGGDTPVTLTVADRFGAEAGSIAEAAVNHFEADVDFRDQAVVCRTHGQLAMVSEALTANGVPVFYLGQLFERDEVRDLLSLLDLASSDHCHSLLRVGEIAEYGLTLQDIFGLVGHCEGKGSGLSEVDPDDPALKISDEARETVRRIKEHISVDTEISAYRLLIDYLFSRSEYLRELLASEDLGDKQKLIAIYQLVGFAGSLEDRFKHSSDQIGAFLQYIKRLVMFREQKNLAEIPEAASGLNAVRLLTVHGAKGLEFESVYLPFLAARKFPADYRGEKCPTPPGLRGDPKDDHIEEEECLFFVAVSRARDHLHISRTINYSERITSKPSPFLTAIEDVLPDERTVTSPPGPPDPSPVPPEEYARREFYAAELDRYLECGKQYYYRHEAGLKAGDNRTEYQKLHGAVFETLRAVQDSEAVGEDLKALARETFERLWEEAALGEHPYAALYREKADDLLERVVEWFGDPEGRLTRKTISVPLSNGVVRITADALEVTEIGGSKRVVAKDVKTGKQPKTVETKHADAVLLHGLKREYPDAEVDVSKVYLSDGSEYVQKITDRVIDNRLGKYEEAVDGINRGEFEPNPSEFRCPTCAYFFMCQKKRSGD